VVLVNSNPATIMTDPEFGDRTYIEPITPEVVRESSSGSARRRCFPRWEGRRRSTSPWPWPRRGCWTASGWS